jgi:hypothetical protein
MGLATTYKIFAVLRASISWLWAAVNDEFSKNFNCHRLEQAAAAGAGFIE